MARSKFLIPESSKSGVGPSWLVLALFLAGTSLLSACNPTCNELCTQNARYIDGCLEYWEALWPDLGFDGRHDSKQVEGSPEEGAQFEGGPAGEYQFRCRERYAIAIRYSEVEAGREIRLRCAEDLQAVADSVGCVDYTPSDVDPFDPTEGDNGVAPRPDGDGS